MKNIAVIGSGNLGSSLAHLAATKYSVTVGSRSPAETQVRLPGLIVADYETAIQSADLIFLAVPFVEISGVAARLGNLSGKTVVDVTNPLTPDFMALTVGYTTSAGETVQDAFPKAKVVKAFNTLLAQVMQKATSGAKDLPSVLVAGDDPTAKEEVIQFAESLGLDAYDTGALSNARYIEPLAELTIQLAYGQGRGGEIGFSLVMAG